MNVMLNNLGFLDFQVLNSNNKILSLGIIVNLDNEKMLNLLIYSTKKYSSTDVLRRFRELE